MPDRDILRQLDKETLIGMLEDAAKNWLAHDGLWFQAVERHFGMESAIQLDAEAWQQFTVIEARRIMRRHNIPEGGGIDALERALRLRLYARINEMDIERVDDCTLRMYMRTCRVQDARRRKGLPDFPCKPVGIVEYTHFARTIDPRIRTRPIAVPPDPEPRDFWCGWEFHLHEDDGAASQPGPDGDNST